MYRKLGFLIMAVAALSLVFSATAVADPTGDAYFGFSTNLGVKDVLINQSGGLPGTGALLVPLTWDGMEESVALPTVFPFNLGIPVNANMTYNEQNISPWFGNPAFAATPGTGFEFAGGQFLETSMRTDATITLPFGTFSGFFLLTDNLGETFISWDDIDISSGPAAPSTVTGTSYIYFSTNGVPQLMVDAGGNDLTFIPHPLSFTPFAPPPTPGYDPTGLGIPATQVLALGDDPWFPLGAGLPFSDGADFGISTGALLAGLSYPIFAGAVGLAAGITSINGINMGVIVDATLIASGDIKPGSDPNSINLGSNGVIPMAVLTTDDFDATSIDPSTVTFADQATVPGGGLSAQNAVFEDVDGDGDLDLSLKFSTQGLVDGGFLGETSADGTIHGFVAGGESFAATDAIRLVPAGDGNNDQVVGADDYTVWANGFGTNEATLSDGDFDENKKVDAADYTIWANNFGADLTNIVPGVAPTSGGFDFNTTITNTDFGDGGGAASVPEPSTFVLTCFGLVALLAYGWRRRK